MLPKNNIPGAEIGQKLNEDFIPAGRQFDLWQMATDFGFDKTVLQIPLRSSSTI